MVLAPDELSIPNVHINCRVVTDRNTVLCQSVDLIPALGAVTFPGFNVSISCYGASRSSTNHLCGYLSPASRSTRLSLPTI